MEGKKRKFFRIFGLISLTLILISLLILNIIWIKKIPYGDANSLDVDALVERKLQSEIWELEREKDFLERYCDIKDLLPQEDSETIKIEIVYYESKIPVDTRLNVYSKYTEIYEVGTLTEVENTKVLSSVEQMRVYRIEVQDNPKTYLEYVSHRSVPYLYIVKDLNSSIFLIDPILNNLRIPVESTYYLENI